MSYSVEIEGTGITFPVAPGEHVLDAALRAGRRFPFGCRSGTCASCKARVLRGTYTYGDAKPAALSEAETQAGFALLCLARPTSDLLIRIREIETSAEIAVRMLPCRVARLERLAPDVMGLWLKLPSTERLNFLAGQYIEIVMRDGRARSFSLANPPHHDEFLELHVRHYPGGIFSDYVFNQMQEKQLLRMRGPLGNFYLREDSERPLIFMAGGTGFAPIKSIIEHALAKNVARPMHLYWGARRPVDLYLDGLARGWESAHAQVRYVPVLSEPAPADEWIGRVGLVHEAIGSDFPDLSGHEVYTAGPPPMVNAAKTAFPRQGLDLERLYYDSFEFTTG